MAESQLIEAPAATSTAPVTPVNSAPPPNTDQTPLVNKPATNAFAMEEPKLDKAYLVVAQETRGHYLVGMTPQIFLDTFLPWKQSTPEKVPDPERVSCLRTVPPIEKGRTEESMYKPFVDALNGWVTGKDNNQPLVFKRFANPDSACARMNVDIATYWSKDLPSTSTSFSHQQTHEEFKVSYRYDAFEHALDEGPGSDEEDDNAEKEEGGAPKDSEAKEDDECATVKTEEIDQGLPKLKASVERDTQICNNTRGQIAAYAGVALSMAFRSHFFSMLILGKYARFIRWDRRGAIVTHRFDYAKSPNLIFSFYHRYGQLTHRERGFDLSAEPWQGELPKNVSEAFDSYYQRSWHGGSQFNHRTGKDDPVVPASKQRFFTLTVKDKNPNPTTELREEVYFVPAPVYRRACISPFSRASRRCLAYFNSANEMDRQMCFLKDSWQETSARSAPEADIYRRLHDNGVKNIASMRLGGDVDDLVTVTQNWFHVLSHSGRYGKLMHMVCHRLILNTVARDLSTFVWCKVLLSCLADAMEAAQQAYKAGVLHRDISAGNVMIVRNNETGEWKGILIDWDMCLLWEEQKLIGEVRTQRTGTWAFISAELLMLQESGAAPVVHSLWHDMESFFWVLLYQALRYLGHNVRPVLLFRRMKALFLDPIEEDGLVYGGDEKETTLQFCSLKTTRKKVATFTISGLNEFLETVGHLLHSRYEKKAELPNCDLNNPDDKWLPNLLRSTADNMAPLNVTRTAVASPTNDSQPPVDKSSWKTASVTEAPLDFCIMPWSVDKNDSALAQTRHFQSMSSSVTNFLDGLRVSHGSKRAHDDVDDVPDTKENTKVPPIVKIEPVASSTKRVRRG